MNTDTTYPNMEESVNRIKKTIIERPKDRAVWVVKDQAKVVGMCFVRKRDGVNSLGATYVLPEYQGRGIGWMMWKEAQKHFDPNKNIIVQVAIYNENAIDFYKKLGFEDTGKRWEDDKFKMKSGAALPELEMVIKVNK